MSPIRSEDAGAEPPRERQEAGEVVDLPETPEKHAANAVAGQTSASDTDDSPTSTMAVEPPAAPRVRVNGTSELPGTPSRPRLSSMRSSSSKFASLRAAFEKSTPAESPTDGLKRRLTSNEKMNERSRERANEQDAEIMRLKGQLAEERALRIAFEDKVTAMEDEIEELTAHISARDEAFRAELERRNNNEPSNLEDGEEDRLAVLPNDARGKKLDAEDLQRQLTELKRSLSRSIRTTEQTSDATFRQEIGILQHEVQNWVVNNFRKVKLDASPEQLVKNLDSLGEEAHVEQIRPIYSTFDPNARLAIYQATVACFLMEIFADPFLFGLQGQIEWAKRARQAAQSLSTALEPGRYNRWRAVTCDALRQSKAIQGPVESAANAISEMICITLKATTDVEESESRVHSLRTIVKKAISLAHLIRVQQAPYEFVLPTPRERFNGATMDDIEVESDGPADRTVRCSTFPALFKIGDENGEILAHRNVVYRAKVLCNDEDD